VTFVSFPSISNFKDAFPSDRFKYFIRPFIRLNEDFRDDDLRDAAHRVHPLAGQGLNLGFGDVITLTWLLAEANMNGSQLNNMLYLRRYETLRQQQNVPTMLVIDAFHRLYKTTAAPVVLARSLGMQLMNAIPQVKVTRTKTQNLFWIYHKFGLLRS
jgi:hypothetical protein